MQTLSSGSLLNSVVERSVSSYREPALPCQWCCLEYHKFQSSGCYSCGNVISSSHVDWICRWYTDLRVLYSGWVDILQQRISNCFEYITAWYIANWLQLNLGRTEVLWCASAHVTSYLHDLHCLMWWGSMCQILVVVIMYQECSTVNCVTLLSNVRIVLYLVVYCILHCISLAILSRLSHFPSPVVGTNWPLCHLCLYAICILVVKLNLRSVKFLGE